MKYFCCFLLLVISTIGYGQKISAKVDELKELGKDSLIQIAICKMQNDNSFTGFDPDNFDRVKVFIDGDALYVVFGMSILYSPENSSYIYSILVYLTDESLTWSPLSNPEDNAGKNVRSFYKPGDEQQKAIELIYKSGQAPKEVEVTIIDHPDHYEIREIWPASASFFNVSKATGAVFDEEYEELAVEEEDSGLIEIKK